jgi:hypothetical protein
VLDPIRPDSEEIERAVELIDGEAGGIGQKRDIGQPAFGTGELGAGRIQPVRRHGEEGRLMRRGQAALGDATPDRRADAEILPQTARGQHHAELEHMLDVDRGGLRGAVGDGLPLVEHAVDAVDQALQRSPVELVGAAEIMHDARLGPLGGGVPVVLGQRVIRDRGAVPIPALRHPQVHVQWIARESLPVNGEMAESCV